MKFKKEYHSPCGKIHFYLGDNKKLMNSGKNWDICHDDPPYFDGPNKLGYYGANVSSVGVRREGYSKLGNWTVPNRTYWKNVSRCSSNQIIWGINYYDFFAGTGRIVWDKVNGESSFSDCELAYCSFHGSVRMYSFMWNGMMQGKSVNDGKTAQGNKVLNEKRIHPTQKPVALYEWVIRTYYIKGNSIVDFHCGSGSHAIAIHNANSMDEMDLSIDLIEIDETIFDSAVDRFKRYIAQKTIFDI
jgi:site-specific DNA-methyltransferase (adenine-specific)